MIRPFDLRDMALVRRLSEQGVPLHTEPTVTDGLRPLREALFSIVGGDSPTYIWKSRKDGRAGFVQLYLQDDDQHAHILYLSPSLPSGNEMDDAWLSLLDEATADIGRRGIHSVVAEVSETGDELPLLRRAGFAVYTRQDIWQRPLTDLENLPTSELQLSPRQASDDWEIQLLYTNLVPRLVQVVEPIPTDNSGGWVLRENGELTAYIHTRIGSMATWLRLFIHPNAETHADEIVLTILRTIAKKVKNPVYVCVRRYQSWLQNPLERAGFELWANQAVMVRHTVHQARKPLTDLEAVIEAKGIPVSAPIVEQNNYQTTNSN